MDSGKHYGLKMHECVRTAALLLGLDGAAAALDSDPYAPDAETEKLIGLLVRFGNLTIAEAAEEWLPLRTRERVTPVGGRVRYDALEKKPVAVYAVRQKGISVPFKQFYDALTVPKGGECEVEYAFAPAALTLEGESEFADGKPSARTVAYGIACEYCLAAGMTDEAALWDKRFKDALTDAAAPKKSARVRPRAWR